MVFFLMTHILDFVVPHRGYFAIDLNPTKLPSQVGYASRTLLDFTMIDLNTVRDAYPTLLRANLAYYDLTTTVRRVI